MGLCPWFGNALSSPRMAATLSSTYTVETHHARREAGQLTPSAAYCTVPGRRTPADCRRVRRVPRIEVAGCNVDHQSQRPPTVSGRKASSSSSARRLGGWAVRNGTSVGFVGASCASCRIDGATRGITGLDSANAVQQGASLKNLTALVVGTIHCSDDEVHRADPGSAKGSDADQIGSTASGRA